MGRSYLAGAALGAVLMHSGAGAQESDIARNDNPVAQNAPGEIVVTARRRAESLQTVPVAVTAISNEQLADYNITTLGNLRQLAPGVSFDKAVSGSGSSLSIRGVSSSPLDPGIEQSVLVNYDSVPISRGRILSDALFDVEAVEILKGPQALFFGKNSPAGVVSIRSANPTDYFSGFARTAYEFHNDQIEFEGAVSGPIADKLSARLAVFGSKSKGVIRNTNPGIDDPFRTPETGGGFIPAAPRRLGGEKNAAARLTLEFDSGEFKANLKATVSSHEGDGFQTLGEIQGCAGGRTHPISSGVIDPYGDCKLNNRDSRGHFPRQILDAWPLMDFAADAPKSRSRSFLPVLNMTLEAVDDLTLTSTSALYHYNTRSAGIAGDVAPAFFFFGNIEKMDYITQEFRADSDFGGMIDFSAGLFYSNADRDFKVGGWLFPLAADPRNGAYHAYDADYLSNEDTYSAFGQLRFKPIERLELAAGGRYSSEHKKLVATNDFVHSLAPPLFLPEGQRAVLRLKEDNFSPEATITWRATDQIMVFAAYKTGYLAGGFSYPGWVRANTSVANNTFGKEKAEGGEGGIKFESADRRVRGSLVVYDYSYKGLQLTSFDGETATFKTQNAGSTKVRGVEFDANARFGGLTIRASAAYNDSKFKNFAGAQCYTGQTPEQGCINDQQDLTGTTPYRAPKWSLGGGLKYEADVGSFVVDAAVSGIYSSGYYTSLNLNPLSRQKDYALLDAVVGLSPANGPWRISLIGKNLTNEIYGTLGNDAAGGGGDVQAVKGDPRTVALQAEVRF